MTISTSDVVALVGCGSAKRDLARGVECEARRLYVSSYFKKKRQVAEELCDRWFILSARHGLLDPSTSVGYYDESVRDFSVRERTQWATDVVEDLLEEISEETTLVFLAGRDYVEPISDQLLEEVDGDRCVDPFYHTSGIGEQLSLLDSALEARDPFYDPSLVDQEEVAESDREDDSRHSEVTTLSRWT